MDYSKFTEIYGILRADAARYAAIFVSPIIEYSTPAGCESISDQNREFRWREKNKTI